MKTVQSRKSPVLEDVLLKEVLQNGSESFKGRCYLWRVRKFSMKILVELILERLKYFGLVENWGKGVMNWPSMQGII